MKVSKWKWPDKLGYAWLSDEQMRNRWPFSLLNHEQMSNKVGVEHKAVNFQLIFGSAPQFFVHVLVAPNVSRHWDR